MNLVGLLACMVLVACGNKPSRPDSFGRVDLSYAASLSDLDVTLTIIGENHNYVDAEGVLEVSVTKDHDGKAEGSRLCGGKLDVPLSSFNDRHYAKFVVHLSACPPEPESIANWISLRFTPRDGTAPERGGAVHEAFPFTRVKHVVPPDPAIARRGERSTRMLSACKAGRDPNAAEAKAGTTAATAVRAEARPTIEKRMETLPSGMQHGLAALLADPNACNHVFGVSVRWKFTEGPGWNQMLGGERIAFGSLVEHGTWPKASDLADALATELELIGDGWLHAVRDTDPDRTTGPRLVIDIEVASSGGFTVGLADTFPRLELHAKARVVVPPGVDEVIVLPVKRFEPAGQEVKYRQQGNGDTTLASRVVDLMVDQLGSHLGTATLVGL